MHLVKLQESGLQGANRVSITLVTVIVVMNMGFQTISLSVYFKCQKGRKCCLRMKKALGIFKNIF